MGNMFDIVGGMILFGVVLLISLRLNIFTTETATQQNLMVMTQEKLSGSEGTMGTSGIVEYDLTQVGYADTLAPSVVVADSNRITFRADIDNNGSVDSVRYYVTNPGGQPSGSNPNLKRLYRKQNTQSGNDGWYNVSQFRLTYFDAMGRPLTTPVTGSDRSNIRSIKVQIFLESNIRLSNDWDSSFAGVYWEKFISPENIK